MLYVLIDAVSFYKHLYVSRGYMMPSLSSSQKSQCCCRTVRFDGLSPPKADKNRPSSAARRLLTSLDDRTDPRAVTKKVGTGHGKYARSAKSAKDA